MAKIQSQLADALDGKKKLRARDMDLADQLSHALKKNQKIRKALQTAQKGEQDEALTLKETQAKLTKALAANKKLTADELDLEKSKASMKKVLKEKLDDQTGQRRALEMEKQLQISKHSRLKVQLAQEKRRTKAAKAELVAVQKQLHVAETTLANIGTQAAAAAESALAGR